MSTTNQPINHQPDPFDGSASARLNRMGLLTAEGAINEAVLNIFIQIFAASFFDGLCDVYSDREQLSRISAAFSELAERRDPLRIYLLLSLQYDALRKPLPDPIWWLAGCSEVRNRFSLAFAAALARLMTGIEHTKEDAMREPYVKHFGIERYQSLYELRAKSKNLVRIIFTKTEQGDILFLTPFIKRHKRNTMQALEASLSLLSQIRDGSCSIQELSIKNYLKGEVAQ